MLFASLLVSVLLTADAPTLNSDERRYFGDQLQKVVQHASKDLEAGSIRCEVAAMPVPGAVAPPEDRPGEWVSAGARSFLGSWQPNAWSVFFSCSQKGGRPSSSPTASHRLPGSSCSPALRTRGRSLRWCTSWAGPSRRSGPR